MQNADHSFIVNGKAEVPLDVLDAMHAMLAGRPVDLTEKQGDARAFAQRASGDVVWVAGGDGTFNEAVAGLLDRPTNQRPQLGLLPLGTANDFARQFGLHTADLPRWLSAWWDSGHQAIDVGRIGDRVFANQLTIGLPAQVTRDTPQSLKDKLGGLAYLLHGLAALGRKNIFPVEIEAADFQFAGEALLVSVGNGPYGGGGINVHPEASCSDGQLDLLVVEAPGEGWTAEQGVARAVRTTASEITLRLPKGAPANLDGEAFEANPMAVTLEGRAIELLLPPAQRFTV